MGKGSEEKQRWDMKRTTLLVVYALKPTMESFLCAQIHSPHLLTGACHVTGRLVADPEPPTLMCQRQVLPSANRQVVKCQQLPPWCHQQHHELGKVKDLDYKTTAEFSRTNEQCKIPVYFPIQSSHAILYVAKTTEDKVPWSLQQLYLHFDVIKLHHVQRHQK